MHAWFPSSGERYGKRRQTVDQGIKTRVGTSNNDCACGCGRSCAVVYI